MQNDTISVLQDKPSDEDDLMNHLSEDNIVDKQLSISSICSPSDHSLNHINEQNELLISPNTTDIQISEEKSCSNEQIDKYKNSISYSSNHNHNLNMNDSKNEPCKLYSIESHSEIQNNSSTTESTLIHNAVSNLPIDSTINTENNIDIDMNVDINMNADDIDMKSDTNDISTERDENNENQINLQLNKRTMETNNTSLTQHHRDSQTISESILLPSNSLTMEKHHLNSLNSSSIELKPTDILTQFYEIDDIKVYKDTNNNKNEFIIDYHDDIGMIPNKFKHFVRRLILGQSEIDTIGFIIYNRPAYHHDKFIYPVGFRSHVAYYSYKNISKYTRYYCSINDNGERPLFRIGVEDDSRTLYEGNSLSLPIIQIKQAIISAYTSAGVPIPSLIHSSESLFGFTTDVIEYLNTVSHNELFTEVKNINSSNSILRPYDDKITEFPLGVTCPIEPLLIPASQDSTEMSSSVSTSPEIESQGYAYPPSPRSIHSLCPSKEIPSSYIHSMIQSKQNKSKSINSNSNSNINIDKTHNLNHQHHNTITKHVHTSSIEVHDQSSIHIDQEIHQQNQSISDSIPSKDISMNSKQSDSNDKNTPTLTTLPNTNINIANSDTMNIQNMKTTETTSNIPYTPLNPATTRTNTFAPLDSTMKDINANPFTSLYPPFDFYSYMNPNLNYALYTVTNNDNLDQSDHSQPTSSTSQLPFIPPSSMPPYPYYRQQSDLMHMKPNTINTTTTTNTNTNNINQPLPQTYPYPYPYPYFMAPYPYAGSYMYPSGPYHNIQQYPPYWMSPYPPFDPAYQEMPMLYPYPIINPAYYNSNPYMNPYTNIPISKDTETKTDSQSSQTSINNKNIQIPTNTKFIYPELPIQYIPPMYSPDVIPYYRYMNDSSSSTNMSLTQSMEPNKLSNIYFQSMSTSSDIKQSSTESSASESSSNPTTSSTLSSIKKNQRVKEAKSLEDPKTQQIQKNQVESTSESLSTAPNSSILLKTPSGSQQDVESSVKNPLITSTSQDNMYTTNKNNESKMNKTNKQAWSVSSQSNLMSNTTIDSAYISTITPITPIESEKRNCNDSGNSDNDINKIQDERQQYQIPVPDSINSFLQNSQIQYPQLFNPYIMNVDDSTNTFTMSSPTMNDDIHMNDSMLPLNSDNSNSNNNNNIQSSNSSSSHSNLKDSKHTKDMNNTNTIKEQTSSIKTSSKTNGKKQCKRQSVSPDHSIDSSSISSLDSYYSCIYPNCLFTTETEYDLSIHILSHFYNYQLLCPYCKSKENFSSLGAFYKHVINKHFHIHSSSMQIFLKSPVNNYLRQIHNLENSQLYSSQIPLSRTLIPRLSSSSSSSSSIQHTPIDIPPYASSIPLYPQPSYVTPYSLSTCSLPPSYSVLSSSTPISSPTPLITPVVSPISTPTPVMSSASSISSVPSTNKFSCPYPNCSFSCNNKSVLQRHIPIHTGERNWVCRYPYCKYASIQKYNLLRHYSTHLRAKRHECHHDGCLMTFTSLPLFFEHVLQHKDCNPYQCPYTTCNYTTHDKDVLTKHMSTH